jgi:ornithine cyclodeaminase/alanine dehydrogenase-like protein (mu-crystallin family)
VAAVCAVRRIKSVRAYSRRPASRQLFADKMTARLGVPVVPVDTAEEAVHGQSILITATTAREPIIKADWVRPGTHINAVGANSLSRRELDGATLARASAIAVDSLEQARLEAGDLVQAVEHGLLVWESMVELGRIVAGQVRPRMDATAITIFRSLGIALEDVATALVVYRLARHRGMAQPLALWSQG